MAFGTAWIHIQLFDASACILQGAPQGDPRKPFIFMYFFLILGGILEVFGKFLGFLVEKNMFFRFAQKRART